MKIKDFFQKGYYINLDRREDRKVFFENEMGRVGLGGFFERISAEDSIQELDPIRKHCYCSLTYHNLFKKIYEQEYENVVVFEDDAYFYDGGKTKGIDLSEKALDEISNFSDWDMIYFGGHPIHEMFRVSTTLYKAPTILTTHAIGYKRIVIKTIIDEYTPFEDSAIDGWLGQRHYINKYLVSPIAVAQTEGTSDLDAWGKSVGIELFLESYKKVLKHNENGFD
jgi:hypothetical protein